MFVYKTFRESGLFPAISRARAISMNTSANLLSSDERPFFSQDLVSRIAAAPAKARIKKVADNFLIGLTPVIIGTIILYGGILHKVINPFVPGFLSSGYTQILGEGIRLDHKFGCVGRLKIDEFQNVGTAI